MRQAARPLTGRPPTETVPTVAATRPVATRATVDLPAPFPPMRATAPPAGTEKLTLNRARYGP